MECSDSKIYHAGIIPTHLDSHHHTHTLDENQEVVVTLAKKYDLPVRSNFERKDEVRHVDYFEPCFDVVGETDEKNDKSIRVWKNIWQVYS